MDKVRIDKWLWAARFFKTRSLAKAAIDGGKVHCNGQRVKASKEIQQGIQLEIRVEWMSSMVFATIVVNNQPTVSGLASGMPGLHWVC